MFKKDVDLLERSKSQLRNKELKKLKKDILDQFPRIRDEQYETHLDDFLKSISTIVLVKLENRSLIYYMDTIPYFIDIQGRNNLIPTLFFLWKFPKTLRSMTIPSSVSSFLLRGADLFLPGLANYKNLESLQKDEKVAISVKGNPLPIAVGQSNVCFEAIHVNRGQGTAATLYHIYGDKLCFINNNIETPAGFSLRVISPIEEEDISEDMLTNGLDALDISKNPEDKEHCEIAIELSLDDRIRRYVLIACRYLIQDDQLPLLASSFWIIVQKTAACDPIYPHTGPLDMKKSSFRKVSQLLESLTEFISLKEEEYVLYLIDIDRSYHEFKNVTIQDLLSFKQSIKTYTKSDTSDNDSMKIPLTTSTSTRTLSVIPATLQTKVRVIEYFKFSRDLFELIQVNEYLHSIEEETSFQQLQSSHPLMSMTSGKKDSLQLFQHSEIKHILLQQVLDLDDINDKKYVIISNNHSLYKFISNLPSAIPISVEVKDEDHELEEELDEEFEESEDDYVFGKINDFVGGIYMPITKQELTSSLQEGNSIETKSMTSSWKPIYLPKASDNMNTSKKSHIPTNQIKSQKQKHKSKSNDSICSYRIRKDNLVGDIISKLSPYHVILSSHDAIVKSGKSPCVFIKVEKRKGNTSITCIRGLDDFSIDLQYVAKMFKKKFVYFLLILVLLLVLVLVLVM